MNSLSNAETARKWHIRLFGTLEVQCPNGTVVTFEGRKAGELLAYLALHSAKPCDKLKIAALLWKESDPTSARTRLRQDIPKLQSLLQTDEADETSLFDVTRQTVQLRPAWYTTDVQQFQEYLERAAKASDPNTKLQFLNDAVRLYTADLLTEYADWVLPFRSQFRAKYEQAAHEITAIRKELADAASFKQLASEIKAQPIVSPQIPNTPSTVRRPKSLQSRRFVSVVLAVILLFIAGRSLWRPGATAKPPPPSADTPQNSAPPLEYGKEKWVFDYVPREGEKPNSEAKAIIHNEAREFYVTGVVQTEKEDADILTVKLSSKGEQLWAKRYSNRQHECDRGLSIAIAPKGVYVAGESYLPPSPGVKEGWYIILPGRTHLNLSTIISLTL